MLKKLLPWKYLLKRAAKTYDVLDPVNFMECLHKFSEPSEVDEPLELLRAGIVFHARGLLNTKAIQHNLDWVWPYWVERQFDPNDVSFLPRAFSFSHVNLTHRNWTAVGLPDLALYPIVDPRGLVTPFYDGWSLDFWIIDENNRQLLPSRLPSVDQQWVKKDNPALMTVCRADPLRLISVVSMAMEGDVPLLTMRVKAVSGAAGRLAVAVRPYNPEGVQFIEKIAYADRSLRINDAAVLKLDGPPEKVCFSNYRAGDVLNRLQADGPAAAGITCETGMATAAALYPLLPGKMTEICCTIVLEEGAEKEARRSPPRSRNWQEALRGTAVLQVPDHRLQELYEASARTLIHLTAGEPVPGPYTYRRFWFRDACFMLNALLALGMEERTLKHISAFPARQKPSGYYHSQDGEWDSNGQVLWLVNRFHECTGRELDEVLINSVLHGAEWIKAKRISGNGPGEGLLPPGFSAEHFGPNDYYYWDDFWAVAGLRGAALLVSRYRPKDKPWLTAEADSLFGSLSKSIGLDQEGRSGGIPASPSRRLDAGAIGSLIADYPLALLPAHDPRVMATAEFLLAHCMHRGGFFQDIIHSGINAYLTLALAQTLLRACDDRYRDLVRAVADLASPSGQWPEAIHPITGGGCMGDGQHGWAAAEWIMMMRNLFIREEGEGLVIGGGVFPEWLEDEAVIVFGPTPTPYGPVRVEIVSGAEMNTLHIEAAWRGSPPPLCISVPGYKSRSLEGRDDLYLLETEIHS